MRPGLMVVESVGPRPHSTATDGIGTLRLMPIRSSPTMESSSIRSAGGSTRPGMHMELRTLATVTASVATVTVVSGTFVTLVRDTDRDTPLVVAPLGRLDTRITFEEAASADSAVVAVSAAVSAVVEVSVEVAADSVEAVEEAASMGVAAEAVSMEVAAEVTAVDGLESQERSLLGCEANPPGDACRCAP